jgi:lipoprotein-releasing system permease protein
MFEFFIAKRYLKSKHKVNFITIISILSTLGITIGVAALIIVLSVFNGFGGLVKSILINFDPHVKVTVIAEEGLTKIDSLSSYISKIDEVKTAYPFVEGKVVLINENTYEVLNLKGITPNTADDNWGVKNSLFSGEFDITNSDGSDKMIIGLPIHMRLFRRLGDTIAVTSFNNIERTLFNLSLPKTMNFLVTGIFETGNREYDSKYVFTSLESGQNLLGLRNQVTGFELRLNDINDAENVKEKLSDKLSDAEFSVETWYDLHKDLYTVMQLERWAAYIILCLIIAVATFNILGSLTMSVIEKKKDIGVLRSMGVTTKSILRIFMFEGMLIGLIGTAAGTVLGLLVCYLQIEFNLYPLDPAKYIIAALPIKVEWTDIAAITGMSILLTFLASLYPAKRAAKIPVIDAIKWE